MRPNPCRSAPPVLRADAPWEVALNLSVGRYLSVLEEEGAIRRGR